MIILKNVAYGLIIIGLTFSIVSLVGLIRIKNIYNQMHVGCINEMFAFPLILLGCTLFSVYQEMYAMALKIILMIVMIYLVNPLNTYAIVKTIHFYQNKFKKK